MGVAFTERSRWITVTHDRAHRGLCSDAVSGRIVSEPIPILMYACARWRASATMPVVFMCMRVCVCVVENVWHDISSVARISVKWSRMKGKVALVV